MARAGALLLLCLILPSASAQECCGTCGNGCASGQGDDRLDVVLHRPSSSSGLTLGQTWGVPTTVVSSYDEIGKFIDEESHSTPSLKRLENSGAQFFTITPADWMLDETFNESKPLTRWLGGTNGNLFTSKEEDKNKFFFNSVTSYAGNKGWFAADPNTGEFPASPAPSVMFYSASSFIIKKTFNFMENAFWIGLPEIIMYALDVCTSFGFAEAAQEAEASCDGPYEDEVVGVITNANAVCNSTKATKGKYKFSVLSLLSGTHVNVPVNEAQNTPHQHNSDYINIALYKRLHYRQLVNLKRMGNFELQLRRGNCTHRVLARGDETQTLDEVVEATGGILRVISEHDSDANRTGPAHYDINFNPSYVTGTFERDMTQRECQLSSQGTTVRPDGVTPYDENDRHAECEADHRGQTPSFAAAAPIFTPKEERTLRVTVRPAQCLDRKLWNTSWNLPGCYASSRFIFGENIPCETDENGNVFQGQLPRDDPRVADCPNWLTVAAGDNCCEGSNSWAVGRKLECEPGSCFFIDYIIELEDEATGERTLFGNPPNSTDGLSHGTYFVMDPEISYSGPAGDDAEDSLLDFLKDNPELVIIIASSTVACLLCCTAAACVFFRRRRSATAKKSGPKDTEMGVYPTELETTPNPMTPQNK